MSSLVPDFGNNTVHFTSLGCPRNLVDSEVMLGLLQRAGFSVAEDLAEAGCVVVNTCGFLEAARQEGSDTINALLEAKAPDAKVIVTGCMVQQERDVLRERFPGVHYFLGSGETEKIVEAVTAVQPGAEVSSARSFLEWGEVPRTLSTPAHYAYLKIAEGCLKQCSFCIIPKIKGPLRSKSRERVLFEFKRLLDQGVFEVILIAQDLGDFGKERKEVDGLVSLIKAMLEVDRPFWLRLLYVYPDEISDELVEVMASDSRVCRYVDMPIQHVNDEVLLNMKRKTSGDEIKSTILRLRDAMPDIVIRSSLMVGFPGESEAQFDELVEFVDEFELDNVGVFQYSREASSVSAGLPGHVADEVKAARFDRLMVAQLSVVRRKNQRFVGQVLPVLVDGFHSESELLYVGRFAGQCPEIDGQVVINEGEVVFGEVCFVEVTEVHDYDLVGRVVL